MSFAKNKTLLFVLSAGLGILGVVFFTVHQGQKSHTVILVRGTSSAGKTSIIQEFEKLVGANYRVIKIDDFNTNEILERKAKEWGWDPGVMRVDDFMDNYVLGKTGTYAGVPTVLSSGPAHDIHVEIANATYVAFFEYVQQEAKKSDVIVDIVFEYTDTYDQCMNMLRDHTLIKVLVYCPLDVIQERVAQRNLSGKPEEQRTTFQAFMQFPAIYRAQESPDDTIVDTVAADAIRTLLKATIDDFIKENRTSVKKEKLAVALSDLDQFYAAFVKRFKLDELKQVAIVSIHPYDFFINSGIQDPAESAQKLFNYVQAHQ